jgi:hypothetical protein
MKTNTSLSAFTGDVTETRGVLSVELTAESKTLATMFFMVDVKGRYDLLLGRDWIHANGCVPSTLLQCLVQWVGDEVEVMKAEEPMCVASVVAQADEQDGNVTCLSRRDLSDYD